MEIHVKGVEVLSGAERKILDEILNRDLEKLEAQRIMFEHIDVHVKVYHSDGTRKKYSVHVRASVSENVYDVESHDWDLARVLHDVVTKLRNVLEKRLHLSEQRPHREKEHTSTIGYEPERQR